MAAYGGEARTGNINDMGDCKVSGNAEFGWLTKTKGWPAFRAALAKLSQDGEPMTKVADGTDEGGVNGPAAANAAAQARHDARVNRLCELIRANIYPNTGIYREITKDVWNGLGVHVYNYVVEQMNKPLNSKHRTLLNSFFNAATVESPRPPTPSSRPATPLLGPVAASLASAAEYYFFI